MNEECLAYPLSAVIFVEKSRIADNVAGAKCMSTVNDKGQG